MEKACRDLRAGCFRQVPDRDEPPLPETGAPRRPTLPFVRIVRPRPICFVVGVVDRVHALISRLSPAPVCDTCVAERLGLGSTQSANKVREVVGMGGFERRRDICSLCFNERLVTRRT